MLAFASDTDSVLKCAVRAGYEAAEHGSEERVVRIGACLELDLVLQSGRSVGRSVSSEGEHTR